MIDSVSDFLTAPTLPFAARLTAVLLLAFPPLVQQVEIGSLAALLVRIHRLVLALAVIFGPVLVHPLLWLVVAVIHFTWLARAYDIADNHHYLEAYWCTALAAALYVGGDAGGSILARNALLLVGLPFLLSVVWKVVSRTYRNGGFFVFTMISDVRLGAFAYIVAGVPAQKIAAYRRAVHNVRSGVSEVEYLDIPPSLRRTALLLTWWVVVIETAVGVAFLVPVDELRIWQLALLLAFALTTYVLVPIATFSNILLLMLAVATADPTWRAIILVTLGFLTVAGVIGDKLSAAYQRIGRKALDAKGEPSAVGVTTA
ncbi:MAG: hypothetical protein ACRD3G_13990 [Vicinamibacterales bacterium]